MGCRVGRGREEKTLALEVERELRTTEEGRRYHCGTKGWQIQAAPRHVSTPKCVLLHCLFPALLFPVLCVCVCGSVRSRVHPPKKQIHQAPLLASSSVLTASPGQASWLRLVSLCAGCVCVCRGGCTKRRGREGKGKAMIPQTKRAMHRSARGSLDDSAA